MGSSSPGIGRLGDEYPLSTLIGRMICEGVSTAGIIARPNTEGSPGMAVLGLTDARLFRGSGAELSQAFKDTEDPRAGGREGLVLRSKRTPST